LSNGWEQNVKNHEEMLRQAMANNRDGSNTGAVKHIINQLNQAKADYASSLRQPRPAEVPQDSGGNPDIVILDTETISPELLIQLEYENVSGTELINISRSDIIDGRQVVYSPIKNLSSLRRKYNPNNIIAISSNSQSIFSKYLIDLIERGITEPYFDENGDLVVEIEEILDDEVIEVEVDVSGTIDTVEFL